MKSPTDLYKRFNDYLDEERFIYDEWDDDEEEYEYDNDDDEWTEEDYEEAKEAGRELLLSVCGGCLLALICIVVFPVMVVLECMKHNKN